MIKYSLLSFVLSSVLLYAGALSEEQAIQKGSAVSTALVQKLSSELKGQMQMKGAIEALHFCSQSALVLTEQVAKESNAQIKRVSLKNRNPMNAANVEEQTVLSRWEKLQHLGNPLPAYEIRDRSNGEYTYYKPITINNETCLKCHGSTLPGSALSKEIEALYPEDKATGYGMGDLRGMIVIHLEK